jgi:arabinose-5-phosphate isomerase
MNKDTKVAKETIQAGIEALKKLSNGLNRSSQFSKAVNLCNKANKIGITGIGKSKDISLYLSNIMNSLNISAIGMSLQDIAHGGLGFFSKKNDILIIFSKSGESSELSKDLLEHFHKFKIKIIGVSCKSNSMLLKNSTVKILLPKVREAGGLLVPTSSSTMFACFGNALCMALAKRKKLTNKILKKNHPAGSIGSSLVEIHELMAKKNDIPIINSNKTMREAIKEMNKKKLGIVCVKEKNGKIGIITDGDLRRHANNLYKKSISIISTKNPTWIAENESVLVAVEKMNSLKITSLLVAPSKGINKKVKQISGIIHMHNCLSRGIK